MQDSTKNNTPIYSSPALGGLFMIGMGIIFLAATSGLIPGQFIGLFFATVPVLMLWGGAWVQYQANGQTFDGRVLSLLIWSMMSPIAILFYYTGINMANIGAISFIFVGLTIILNRHHTH